MNTLMLEVGLLQCCCTLSQRQLASPVVGIGCTDNEQGPMSRAQVLFRCRTSLAWP